MKQPSHFDCCSGLTASGEPIKYSDNKHILILVDAQDDHRTEVTATLMSLYNIIEFDNIKPAQRYLKEVLPGIVLISAEMPNGGGFRMVRELRKDPRFALLPILMILSHEGGDQTALAKDCGADGWLVKPYRRSALVKLISSQLNGSVEKQWKSLPPLQAQALTGTVEIFNNLSDIIDRGEPIAYGEINDACSPVVDAVNSNNFKGILSGVRDHDNYTYAHSLRVAVFLALFGNAIGLPVKDQKLLATGGLLHDVGKMYIPHLVLNKPGRLTEEEFVVMKEHVNASIRVLEAADNIPKGVITIAAQHHEKLDGTGYPKGLRGSELNELARMASIVDVFSALTDRRVYKPPMTAEKALGIMADEMSTHLDVALLGRFRQMLLDAAVDMPT